MRGFRAGKYAIHQALRTGRPPTELQNPEPNKSARESARGGAARNGVLGEVLGEVLVLLVPRRDTRESTFMSTSPSTPFLAGTSPSTLPSTFGGLRVLHFCRGPPRSQIKHLHAFTLSSFSGQRKAWQGNSMASMARKFYGNVCGESRVNFLALFASKPHIFMCGAIELGNGRSTVGECAGQKWSK